MDRETGVYIGLHYDHWGMMGLPEVLILHSRTPEHLIRTFGQHDWEANLHLFTASVGNSPKLPPPIISCCFSRALSDLFQPQCPGFPERDHPI